jgi:hypothetical protein
MKKWFKDFGKWLKNFRITILFAVFATFVFIGLAVTILIFQRDPQLAGAYTAVGTLILASVTAFLAFFTFLSVKSGYDREKRERKERLLNEIIEWAESVAKSSLETGVFDETIPVSGLAAERALPELLDSVADFRVARAESVYISSIASEISPKLKKSVDNLTEEIKGQIKFLMEYKRKDIPTWPANKVVAKIAGNNERLYNLAETLIDDTANILKKDL